MCITYPDVHNLSTCAQPIQISPEGMAGNEGPGEGTYTTRHQCGGCRRGRRAWPGFEPTRRVKLTAQTVSGRARRSPQPRWRSQQEHQRRSQRNTEGPANGTPVTQPQEHRRRGRRAGPTAPETPVHSQQEHRRHSQQEPRRRSQQKHQRHSSKNTSGAASKNPGGAAATRVCERPGGESPPPGLYARITCR